MLPHKLTSNSWYWHLGYNQQPKPKFYSVTRRILKAGILLQHSFCNMAGSQILTPSLTELQSLNVITPTKWHLPFLYGSNTEFHLVGCLQFCLAKLTYTHNWQPVWFLTTAQNTTVVVWKSNTDQETYCAASQWKTQTVLLKENKNKRKKSSRQIKISFRREGTGRII